jgi:murein L,D-transpeptidase YcbB/YkuD
MSNIKKILLGILLINATLLNLHAETNALTFEVKISNALKKQFYSKRSALLKHINNRKFLQRFYRQNSYLPLWIKEEGLDKEKYKSLFLHINKDLTLSKKGLIVKQTQELSKQVDQNLSSLELLRMELRLTSLYYDFLNHSIYGEIQWNNFSRKLRSLKRSRINASWIRNKPKFSVSKLLLKPHIEETIEEIKPKHFGYQGLVDGLAQLHTIQERGGWEKLPYFKVLKLGSSGEVVVQLRKRLKNSNDYTMCEENATLKTLEKNQLVENNESIDENQSKASKHIDPDAIFGQCLDKAVKTFQKRHGLEIDGIVGGNTRRVLNISLEEKIKKVLLNIDRIKWLPRDNNERYLVVNLPEFKLHYIEDEEVKQQIRVIIGDKKHPTPIFSEKISYVVLNPYWKVPEGIVRREIIPAIVKNPNYLKKHGLIIRKTWYERSKKINPYNIYWKQYLWGGAKFPYRIMQPPGPKNALGKIKFKFPNRFAVYLHDTPTRHLFKKTVRAFSHGCVRIDEPTTLLDVIASFNESIDLPKAKKTLEGKRKVHLKVENKLPVYLIYLTAGLNDKKKLEFRNDIYRYDKFTKRSIK